MSSDLELFADNSPIVAVDGDGVPTTTSLRIAEGTQVQHKNVLELIRNNLADFEEFGGVAFETRPRAAGHGGGDVAFAVLNEEHATLALTYMRNTEIVRDFKKRLVREFYALRNASPALTEDEIVHQALAITARRVEELTAKVAELSPHAAAWTELAEAAGDYSVADAAKVLSRDPAISIGRDRLFQTMHAWRWVYKPRGCGWRAYQDQVDNGRLVEKLAKPYYHQGRDEVVTGEPTVRITPKGIEALQKILGGGSGQLALAVAE